MKKIIWSAVVLSTICLQTNSTLANDAETCELPPSLVSSFETGNLIVSTYHTTGVPGSDRTIQVQWPSEVLNPLSGVPPGRTDGASQSLLFSIPSGELSVRSDQGDMVQLSFPAFSLFVSGASDLYPLYSSLSRIGGKFTGNKLIDSGNGYTYHSSEGFETFPEEDHGDWTRYAYPVPNRVASQHDTFFRGMPVVNGIDAILSCRRWEDGPSEYSQCNMYKKYEPVFYQSRIHGHNTDDLRVIEHVADRLIRCLLGEM